MSILSAIRYFVDKAVRCVDLQFHMETFEFMMKVDHASSPWPPLPPSFSLTIPKGQNFTKSTKKATETTHKKFSEGKQVHARMEASKINQTRWE